MRSVTERGEGAGSRRCCQCERGVCTGRGERRWRRPAHEQPRCTCAAASCCGLCVWPLPACVPAPAALTPRRCADAAGVPQHAGDTPSATPWSPTHVLGGPNQKKKKKHPAPPPKKKQSLGHPPPPPRIVMELLRRAAAAPARPSCWSSRPAAPLSPAAPAAPPAARRSGSGRAGTSVMCVCDVCDVCGKCGGVWWCVGCQEERRGAECPCTASGTRRGFSCLHNAHTRTHARKHARTHRRAVCVAWLAQLANDGACVALLQVLLTRQAHLPKEE
jgi:hypothetical protein